MSRVFDFGPPPPCPKPFNLAAYVLGADVDPSRMALEIVGGRSFTYADLRNAVETAAHEFDAAGVCAGDRVLLRLGNSEVFPITFLALAWIGAIPIITSSVLTVSELDRMIPQVAPEWMVAEPGVSVPSTLPIPLPVPAAVPRHPKRHSAHLGHANRPGYLVFTSGTGATPKPVLHAHRAVWARRMMWADWYDLHPDDRLYHSGAFNWTFTLGTGLLDPWAMGATAIIAPGLSPSFDLICDQSVTLFAAAPGVYRQLLRSDPVPTPALRHGLTAGDTLPSRIRNAWLQTTGTQLFEAYGMTECSTFLSDGPHHGKGLKPQRGRHIALTDDHHIAIHRDDPGLMLGYWDGTKPHLPLSGDWFITQDLAQSDGAIITFLARTDGLLNAGGYRISPVEVEDALSTIPAITDIAVTDILVKPDTTVVACFFVADHAIAPDTFNRFADMHLAPYKRPRLYQRVDALPRTANGKLDRRALPALWRPHDQA